MKLIFLFFVFCFQLNTVLSNSIIITKATAQNPDGKIIDIFKTPVFNYKYNHIKIEYTDSLTGEYQIQLKGFENQWVPMQSHAFANYINLLGGEYQFMVRNSKNKNHVASIKFTIEDVFWQKPWFIASILAYLLLIAGVIYYFFQVNKLKQQARFQKVRNDISADLHDDIGSTLANIGFLTEIAKNTLPANSQATGDILDKIIANSKDMVQTMRGMIWSIDANNDNALDFFHKIRNMIIEMLQPYQKTLTYKTEIEEDIKLNVETQRNLFLIIKEATHNMIKYAQAESFNVIIRREANWLMIQIQDDGKGFVEVPDQEGNGIRNMKNRTESLNGTFEIDSSNGTRLRLIIPIVDL